VTPGAIAFEAAKLTITAWGPLGGNDIVWAEDFNLGPLQEASLGSLGFSTSVFSTTSEAVLDVLLSDGRLDICIDKNRNANFLGKLNAISTFNSELCVRYTGTCVPEPASLLGSLSALAMGGLLIRRRRHA